METIIPGLPQQIASLGFWGSVASILGLLGIFLNTWRLSKVKKIVEEDRFRIAETMRPFDLYFNLQKTILILRQQQSNHLIAQEEKEKAGMLLKGRTEVETCLRQYFREAHCIRKIRANAYVDAGHLFLVKNQPEEAKDYYEKALVEAKIHHNKRTSLNASRASRSARLYWRRTSSSMTSTEKPTNWMYPSDRETADFSPASKEQGTRRLSRCRCTCESIRKAPPPTPAGSSSRSEVPCFSMKKLATTRRRFHGHPMSCHPPAGCPRSFPSRRHERRVSITAQRRHFYA